MKKNGLRARAACLMGIACLPLAAPAQGMYTASEAEAIRKLDIMLMVSSLRCRFGADNFQADYQRFSARHLATLNAANADMQASITRSHGPANAKKALDRLNVSMANAYGQGHPWMDCRQLKEATRSLADRQAGSDLLSDAYYLLAERPASGGVFAARR